MSKNCIITTVKSKIKGNATSFIEKETEIIIPVSNKFTLSQTRAIAIDKVKKINKEYLSEKFGEVVSLNTSYTDGTGINIHPSKRLVDAYEVKEGNKTLEEVNSGRDLNYFNGDVALYEQEQRDFENEANLMRFTELRQELRVQEGKINFKNNIINGFDILSENSVIDKEISQQQAKTIFNKKDKTIQDRKDLSIYFANYFLNSVYDKEGLLHLGYTRFSRYGITPPKLLIVKDNGRKNPFFQYNNVVIIGLKQLEKFINSLKTPSFEKFENLINTVAQEEIIHLYADYLLDYQDIDNIYNEMTEKDINQIKKIYGNASIQKENIVHEYVRMVVQQRVFGRTTEYETFTLSNAIMSFFENLLEELNDFLNRIIGSTNTQKAIEDVINFTKGNFSKELDEKIINRVFDKGQILEANLNVLNNFQEEQEELDKIVKQTNNIKENETPASEIKPGVEELFESNPELANTVYSKILTNSGISAENLLSLLEKENIVEKDCSGGKLKAKDGISTLFDKGGKWGIVTDFKNAPTHKSGGKDVSIQGKKVEVEKNELRIENDFGDVAVIPSKYRIEVQDAIKSNCHSCIDGIVESLPKMKDYAGDGTVFPFFGRYKRFKNSLPDNLKNTPEDEYAMRYYWKHSNKPKSFDEAINREQPMFTMEDDGYYHAPSVEPNTLRFLKPKTHPTLQYELDWYNSDNPEAVDFRNKYDLDTSDKFYRYIPKKR